MKRLRQVCVLAVLLAACGPAGLALPNKPLDPTPAKLIALTIWLPDGRAVVPPPGTASFKELALALNAITPFSNEIARQAMMAQIHWGPLFPAWTINPNAVCVEAEFDRPFAGGFTGGTATRLVLGSGKSHLPETDLIVAAGRWLLDEWLQLPTDQRRIEPLAPALSKAVQRALARLKPSKSPLIVAPQNLEVSTTHPERKRLGKVPIGVWIALHHYISSLRAKPDDWAPVSAVRSDGAVAVLVCQFKTPLRIEGAGKSRLVLAFEFISFDQSGRGLAWAFTDGLPLRHKSQSLRASVDEMLRGTFQVPW